jgi:hypothetical protein
MKNGTLPAELACVMRTVIHRRNAADAAGEAIILTTLFS